MVKAHGFFVLTLPRKAGHKVCRKSWGLTYKFPSPASYFFFPTASSFHSLHISSFSEVIKHTGLRVPQSLHLPGFMDLLSYSVEQSYCPTGVTVYLKTRCDASTRSTWCSFWPQEQSVSDSYYYLVVHRTHLSKGA